MITLPIDKDINAVHVSPTSKNASVDSPLPLTKKIDDEYPPDQGKSINVRYPSPEAAASILSIPLTTEEP